MMLLISEAQYREHANNHGSWCPDCGDLEINTEVEPDHMGAYCGECLNSNVMGVEQALLSGKVEFTEAEL